MNVMNRFFNFRACSALLLSAISYLWMHSANAGCTSLNGWKDKVYNIYIPAIVVPRDAPVGTVLFSQSVTFPIQEFATGCVDGYAYIYARLNNGLNPDSNGVAPTNLSGIGVRVLVNPITILASSFQAAGSSQEWLAYSTAAPQHVIAWRGGEGFTFQIIKTGPISNGALAPGTYGNISLKDYRVALVYVVGGQFVTSGCSVNSTTVTVPLGSVKRSEFSGVGSTTQTNTFNILVNCTGSPNVSMTLNAIADSSNAPGVIAIGASAGNTTASGVGVQLLRNNSPVVIGSPFAIEHTAVTGGRIEMAARYYQTKSTITVGQANATATFTFTYN